MISNEKQYKRTGNTKYAEDFVDYNPEMKASRNSLTKWCYSFPPIPPEYTCAA